jgi:hypothetical protein
MQLPKAKVHFGAAASSRHAFCAMKSAEILKKEIKTKISRPSLAGVR